MRGTIADITRSFTNNRLRVTFEVDSVEEIRGMEGDLDITVKKHREKRSLSANAYFHVLVGKIADTLGISKPKAKNILLGRYGQREIIEEKPVVISVISKVDMQEREDIHCIPVGHGHVEGKEFTHWAVVRPSHTYDTREMSKLIDGTVDEAKELGIETLTPAEIERMKKAWQSQSYRAEKNVSCVEPQSDFMNIM